MKLYFYPLLFLTFFCFSQQQIAIVGTATEDWVSGEYNDPPILMYGNGQGKYFYDAIDLNEGYVQFIDINNDQNVYGGIDFPSGNFTSGEIEIIPGLYYIEIDLVENTYFFMGFPMVYLGWGFSEDVSFTTGDLIHFEMSPREFTPGYRFINAYTYPGIMEPEEIGSNNFPTGIANEYHPIPIEAGFFSVSFNYETLAYAFEIPEISLIGSAVANVEDDDQSISEVIMQSENGFFYTLDNVHLQEGEVKFFQEGKWQETWSGTNFPVGELTENNELAIIIPETGYYSVEFDRQNETYSFTTLSLTEFDFNQIKVYPNPTKTHWNFSFGDAVIDDLKIHSITGKLVFEAKKDELNKQTFFIDANSFSKGIYLVTLSSMTGSQKTMKLVKN